MRLIIICLLVAVFALGLTGCTATRYSNPRQPQNPRYNYNLNPNPNFNPYLAINTA